VQFENIMEGRKGEKSRELVVYDLEQRRLIDAEIIRRTTDFMKRSVQSGKPFYVYVPFTLVHFQTLPNRKFAGKTGFGIPDAEMDVHVGEILDTINELGIRDNTIVVFTSDNGPEATWPWQGSSGPWRGYCFTHMERSLLSAGGAGTTTDAQCSVFDPLKIGRRICCDAQAATPESE
jgi:Sulfatase